jgi:hypothetical protein
MTDRLPLRVGLAVGMVAGCVLALQVLLSRLFSAELFYHFSFLSISLALLGAGAGAIAVYLRPAWFDRRPLEEQLARWSIALAALLIVVPLILAHIRYGTGNVITATFVVHLTLTSVLSTVLFCAAGTVIALAVRNYVLTMSRLYAFDLAGAALGAVVVVPLMWRVSVPTLIVAIGPVAACAALLFAGGTRRPMGRAATVVVGAGLLAVILASTSSIYDPKPAEASLGKAVSDRWTPISRVVAYRASPGALFEPLFYDRGGAPVAAYRRGAQMPDWRKLHLGPQSLGYVFGGGGRALVIGGGGGRDILNALTSGVRRLDVIELNRGIVDTVDGPLRSFSGAPYVLPHVHTVVGDGRSTLAESGAHYNVIHIGNTDTLSSNSAQAFALTENNLYTVQAVNEYFDHLKPGGVLALSRPYRLVGDEALRLTVLTLEGLRERGIVQPQRNVVVVLGRDILGELTGTVLARLRPWTATELARMRMLGRQRGVGVAYAPGGPYQLEWAALARAQSPQAFCSSFRLDVCAPTDDKPFFFEMRRLGSFGSLGPGYIYAADPFLILLVTFVILLALSLMLVLAPLVLTARSDRPPLRALGFFAAIGLGFLTLEITLIQRFELFLGFPTYALSVVLFALLLWTGAGSLVAGRVRNPQRALTSALVVACLLIVASAFGLRPLLAAIIGLPFAARVVVTVALLAPAGIALGMAMPLGLIRLAALYPRGVAWAWGVNGIASVVASAGSITVAIIWGFPIATLVALVCYLGALVHVRWSAWPQEAGFAPHRPMPVAESRRAAETVES